jgi:hypothetical protein
MRARRGDARRRAANAAAGAMGGAALAWRRVTFVAAGAMVCAAFAWPVAAPALPLVQAPPPAQSAAPPGPDSADTQQVPPRGRRTASWRRPATVSISTDNDAYLFWRKPWERTDHEYTSGARGTVEYAGPSGVLPLARWRRACDDPRPCVSHSFSLGQELYTGEPPPAPGVAPAAYPSHRTNAAWLYVEAAERDSVGRDVREVSARVGVVGPPALGGPMQEFFHVIGPRYPLPVDWSHQLPFEPGFVVAVTRRRVVARVGNPDASMERVAEGGASGAAVSVHGSAAVGTIFTGASGGIAALGVLPVAGPSPGARWPRVAVSVEATGYGVLRDEFLDGTFFRSSPRLEKRPFYDEGRVAVELWWSRLRLGYRVAHTGPRYRLQGAPLTWGTLLAEWRPR